MTDISSIILPVGVTTIPTDAFSNTPNLASIYLPDTLTTIQERAFSTSGLVSVIIPDFTIVIA